MYVLYVYNGSGTTFYLQTRFLYASRSHRTQLSYVTELTETSTITANIPNIPNIPLTTSLSHRYELIHPYSSRPYYLELTASFNTHSYGCRLLKAQS